MEVVKASMKQEIMVVTVVDKVAVLVDKEDNGGANGERKQVQLDTIGFQDYRAVGVCYGIEEGR